MGAPIFVFTRDAPQNEARIIRKSELKLEKDEYGLLRANGSFKQDEYRLQVAMRIKLR